MAKHRCNTSKFEKKVRRYKENAAWKNYFCAFVPKRRLWNAAKSYIVGNIFTKHYQMEQYTRIAHEYAAERKRSNIGTEEIESLLQMLPKGASILDVGCGTGQPISEYISRHPHQFKLFAADSSDAMTEIFRRNLPDIPVQCSSILTFDFFGQTFDAVVSWGMMFHLTPDEQRSAIERISAALRNGGYFLFTSGNEADTRHGAMYGVEFAYYSLGSEEYREVLRQHGCTLIEDYVGEGENYYYLAQKTV
jgi:SAM-dependent methyltransferase